MHKPKQLDLGGVQAWQGGNRAIGLSDMKGIIYCFARRRLQSLAKVTGQPDPTNVVGMTFETMLVAVENIAPNPALHYDHAALRGIRAGFSFCYFEYFYD